MAVDIISARILSTQILVPACWCQEFAAQEPCTYITLFSNTSLAFKADQTTEILFFSAAPQYKVELDENVPERLKVMAAHAQTQQRRSKQRRGHPEAQHPLVGFN